MYGGRICGSEEARYIWAVAAGYIWALAQDTIPLLDNVTRHHCHSRLLSQIFPVSRSGIILTVCFLRKRTLLTFWAFWEAEGAQKAKSALFLAKQTYEKWHHFFALTKIYSVPAECQWCLVTLSKRGFRARVKMYLAAKAQMYLVLRPKWTWPQILPPMYDKIGPITLDDWMKNWGRRRCDTHSCLLKLVLRRRCDVSVVEQGAQKKSTLKHLLAFLSNI